jgi:3-keto-5-aminohexanoate cleavage enzyme
MNKLIITLAPTGMIPTKEMKKHVPVRPLEIVREVIKCAPLGVAMVHIHARDHEDVPTYKTEFFKEIISAIRRTNPDLIITATPAAKHITNLKNG